MKLLLDHRRNLAGPPQEPRRTTTGTSPDQHRASPDHHRNLAGPPPDHHWNLAGPPQGLAGPPPEPRRTTAGPRRTTTGTSPDHHLKARRSGPTFRPCLLLKAQRSAEGPTFRPDIQALPSAKGPTFCSRPDHQHLIFQVTLGLTPGSLSPTDYGLLPTTVLQAKQTCICNSYHETNPADNIIPSDLYRTKKLVSKLGLTATKIDCCINGCMLYYKDDAAEVTCHICNAPRFKQNSGKQRRPKKDVSYSRLFYLPIIPRLQRLYASMSSAGHMRWHKEKIAKSDVLSHPSDAEAWKHFDRVHPSFAAEPRNIRLGLCTDGFTPYSQTATPYSCWPVILTPYNLPPEMCMTTPFMFLTLIIPGPHNPKAKIDIYLQPLIDDLKLLWEGVLTYDISIKQNFLLRAALLWTIGDFPAYGMLSGWSTAGKLACPYCMENSKAFTLKHGGKNTWFDCHRMFLHANHQFRRNKEAFVKNRIERSPPPPRLSGDEILQRLSNIPTIIEYPMLSESKFPGYGVQHNWIKKSIFWTLPYWRTNLIRHNLDVMHIEKNFLDNIFNTIMDVKGKSKDNVKAMMDIKEFCRRKNLELVTTTDGKLMKPKAPYSFTLEQKRMICQWFKGLKMPDGYGSNISRCVDLKSARLFGLKSHDCHIIMEVLLPIIVSMLPDYISNPLIELSIFFKDLCSSKLSENALRRYEDNIPIILCKLEKIFPPGFFDSMEHLPVHLPYEARVGGPVQYRWMYPFERYLNKLKKYVKNKARPEGSICEAYLSQETTHFCSYYFEPHVRSTRTKMGRNMDFDVEEQSHATLTVFRRQGKPNGKCVERYLNDLEINTANLYVLLNCEEVQNPDNKCFDKGLQALAWGPMRKVKTWPIYIVNGFRFHTKSWSEGRKTENYGVCVRGNTHEEDECDYYGILNEVLDLEYPEEDENFVCLFNCQWYDPVQNRGTRVHPVYGLVDVKHSRRYGKFDPFVLASQAIQVYFSKYPSGRRDKQDCLAVIKTKARGIIDQQYIVATAHQEDEMSSYMPVEIEDMPTTTSTIEMELEDVNSSTSSEEEENQDESEDTLESDENSFDDSD
ncbi:hypothetical protein KFK09_009356 [Dendrobium nobile]|uniref:DUF4218 domain-containing protein n=1 Tax=Dendrobium nobile TaxID=94219 RepID=A0A8T3BQ63_DENNO|nr:hypothetical protein KFK09_009356 [Dendrobium nobile]